MGDYEEFEKSFKATMDNIDRQIKAYEKEAEDYLSRFD